MNGLNSRLDYNIVLEISPHSALAGPLRQIFQDEITPFTHISSLRRGKDDTESIYNCIGNLWTNNFTSSSTLCMLLATFSPTYRPSHGITLRVSGRRAVYPRNGGSGSSFLIDSWYSTTVKQPPRADMEEYVEPQKWPDGLEII